MLESLELRLLLDGLTPAVQGPTIDPLDPKPVCLISVQVNDAAGRTVRAIDPSGGGLRSIKVMFSEGVTFAPDDVIVQKVEFGGNAETVTGTLLPTSVDGSGSAALTIHLAAGSAVDTWVKVTLKGDGTLKDLQGNLLDGEPKAGGSGRIYIYDAATDLPTGDGAAGGDAVFYVGSLRGDFASVGGGQTPDGRITPEDVDGFLARFLAADPDADFRGAGFTAAAPDGRVTPADIDGFLSLYNVGVAEGRRLETLPDPGPLDLVIARASAALKETASGLVAVAPGAARLEAVATGPILGYTTHGEYNPFCVDTIGDNLLIGGQSTNLYAMSKAGIVSAALVTGAQLKETADDVVNLTAVKAHGSTWFLFVRNRVPRDGVNWCGKVFRTTDGGATLECVHRNHYGGAPISSSPDLSPDGKRLAYGSYFESATGVPAPIWLCENADEETLVWDAVYEDLGDPNLPGRHVHQVRFDPEDPDVIYACLGDDPNSAILRLTRPAGWHPGDGAWTAQWLYQNDLTWSSEGGVEPFLGKFYSDGNFGLVYDPATGEIGRFLNLPLLSMEAAANSRYSYWGGCTPSKVHNLLAYGGVLYASGYVYSNVLGGHEGIYASPDGLHWTALIRDPAHWGFRDLTCAWNGRIWCSQQDSFGHLVMASFPVADVRLIQALRLEAGAASVITGRPDSTFTNLDGTAPTFGAPYTYDAAQCHATQKWWGAGEGTVALAIVAGGADGSGHCLQADFALGSIGRGLLMIPAQPAWSCATAVGQRVLLRARVKAVAPWPQNFGVGLYIYGGGAGTIAADVNAMPLVHPSEDGWIDLVWEGTVTALDGNGRARPDNISFTVQKTGAGPDAVPRLLIDCVMIDYGADWRTGGSYVDPRDSPRADESASLSLAGYGTPLSVLFDWRPESGWANYGAPLPLVSFRGAGGTYVDLSYQPATRTFLLSDGVGSASSTAISWRDFDTLRFALSSDSLGCTLRIWDPAGGLQEVAAPGIVVGAPASLVFGTDHAGATFGAGHFSSLGVLRQRVTAAEFAAIVSGPGWSFDRPVGALPNPGVQRDPDPGPPAAGSPQPVAAMLGDCPASPASGAGIPAVALEVPSGNATTAVSIAPTSGEATQAALSPGSAAASAADAGQAVGFLAASMVPPAFAAAEEVAPPRAEPVLVPARGTVDLLALPSLEVRLEV